MAVDSLASPPVGAGVRHVRSRPSPQQERDRSRMPSGRGKLRTAGLGARRAGRAVASFRWGVPLLLLLLGACAVNPVTGERELTLISERQEIEIGRDADQDITRSLGLHEDDAWQEYVQELGERMARESERPDLPWTFRVLDDPVVNAFALPGGYIYVTRGILTHFSSEAELAGVLGHEIGHVTARHGVRQVSRAQLAQLGLGIGTILVPELRPFEDIAGAGLGLLFLKYGRDAERQADDLGLQYMTREGYDPREMAATFEMLAAASGALDGDRLPGWLSTHPDPMERRDRILEAIEAGEAAGERVNRESYLQRLEGMPFGENPREGFFRDAVFYHPQMAFRVDLPEQWTKVNQRDAVQAMHPDQDAAVLLTLAEGPSAREALDRFLSDQATTGSGLREDRIHGLSAARAEFRATSDGTDLRGIALFIEHDGRVFRLLGYAVEGNWNARRTALVQAIESFQEVTDPAILELEPRRIELVRTDRSMSLEEFDELHPSTVPLETIGTINRLNPGDTIPRGTLLKRVTGGLVQ